jgi:hypothetical protein
MSDGGDNVRVMMLPYFIPAPPGITIAGRPVVALLCTPDGGAQPAIISTNGTIIVRTGQEDPEANVRWTWQGGSEA